MKYRICIAAAVAALALPTTTLAVNLSDLMNPDDVMLRKPTQKDQGTTAAKVDEAAARADVERRFQEAKARAMVEQQAAEAAKKALDEQAAAVIARKAAEEAAARKAAEEAAARKAAEEAAARKAAEEAAAAKVVAETQAREQARVDAELKRLREQVAAERAARAKAEAATVAAEAVARKAQEEKANAEKKAAYLANPDPDERPVAPTKKKLAAEDEQKDVTETVPAVVVEKKAAPKKTGKGGKEQEKRQAVITADRTDADFKEGVILLDQNVSVDDGLYQLHADRAFVFLEGTNDLKRIVALGNVAITNGARTAVCAKAVYKRGEQQVVLYGDENGPAELTDASDAKAGPRSVYGARITYWIETGAAVVEKPILKGSITGGSGGPKDIFQLNPKKKE